MIDLEVFILTYNRASLLGETLESVCKQTAHGFDIIVLDNASTDDTESVFLKYQALYPNRAMKFISTEKNIGVIGNIKRAQILAKKEWAIIFHDDDLMHPEYIKTIIGLLKTTQNSVLGGCAYVPMKDPSNSNWKVYSSKAFYCDVRDFAALLFSGYYHCFPSAVYKTKVLKKVKVESKKYGITCDRPLLLSVAEKGVTVTLKDSYIRYRIHANQDSSDTSTGPFENEWFALLGNYKKYLGDNIRTATGKVYNDFIDMQLMNGYNWMKAVKATNISLKKFIENAEEKEIFSSQANVYGKLKNEFKDNARLRRSVLFKVKQYKILNIITFNSITKWVIKEQKYLQLLNK